MKIIFVYDISIFSSWGNVGTYDTTNCFDVYVDGQYAYLADSNDGLRVVQIQDVVTLAEIGSESSIDFPKAMDIHGN